MPSAVDVPATACTPRCTIPSPPTTTSASTPSATQCRARSRVSSASRPTRLRTRKPASLNRGRAMAAVRTPRPFPEVGFVSSAISLDTPRGYVPMPHRPRGTLYGDAMSADAPTTLLVPLPDGRRIEVLVSGPEDGLPLVVHHGTPQAAVAWPALTEAAEERGLRVVAASRPGYGASDPREDGATTATVADDAGD